MEWTDSKIHRRNLHIDFYIWINCFLYSGTAFFKEIEGEAFVQKLSR